MATFRRTPFGIVNATTKYKGHMIVPESDASGLSLEEFGDNNFVVWSLGGDQLGFFKTLAEAKAAIDKIEPGYWK